MNRKRFYNKSSKRIFKIFWFVNSKSNVCKWKNYSEAENTWSGGGLTPQDSIRDMKNLNHKVSRWSEKLKMNV